MAASNITAMERRRGRKGKNAKGKNALAVYAEIVDIVDEEFGAMFLPDSYIRSQSARDVHTVAYGLPVSAKCVQLFMPTFARRGDRECASI